MQFYCDTLGFEVTADISDPNNPDNRWLTLRPNGAQTNIMLLRPSPRLSDLSPPLGKPTIVIETDDLDAACERIKSGGGRVTTPPKRAGWGAAMEAHFADPDGNVFLLIQRMEN